MSERRLGDLEPAWATTEQRTVELGGSLRVAIDAQRSPRGPYGSTRHDGDEPPAPVPCYEPAGGCHDERRREEDPLTGDQGPAQVPAGCPSEGQFVSAGAAADNATEQASGTDRKERMNFVLQEYRCEQYDQLCEHRVEANPNRPPGRGPSRRVRWRPGSRERVARFGRGGVRPSASNVSLSKTSDMHCRRNSVRVRVPVRSSAFLELQTAPANGASAVVWPRGGLLDGRGLFSANVW